MTQTLRLGIFSANVVADWAEEHGVFADHGLAVEQIPVASSPAQFASLMAGEYDAVLTSPDNVATYVLNEAIRSAGGWTCRSCGPSTAAAGSAWSGGPAIERSTDLAGAPVRRRRPDLRASPSSASPCSAGPASRPAATTRS